MSETRPQIYHLLSTLLDYPNPGLLESARKCTALLAEESPAAAAEVERFLALTEKTEAGRLEEIYTGTFDINPTCTIYAGYQLFGESYKRGEFLARLREKYRERDFFEGNELADHLAVVLRFLGRLDPEEPLARELTEDCLLPALEKMNRSFPSAETGNPYALVLKAAASIIEQDLLARPGEGESS